ncbi:MAG: recombination mediator RecR [Vulcanimicrobiota bacterium]
MFFSEPVANLVNELMKLPSIGPKSAQRLAFHIIRIPDTEAEKLMKAIKDVKEKVRHCKVCFNLTDKEICDICSNDQRAARTICVVANSKDIPPIEKSRVFKGKYHVLGGLISPLDGIGPDNLNIKPLLNRVSKQGTEEIIIATDSDTNGEITAMYLDKVFKPLGVKVSRLAYGLPMGASLEYTDEITLSRAFEGRREMGKKENS